MAIKPGEKAEVDAKEVKIVQLVQKQYDQAKMLRQPLERIWEEDDRQYNNQIDERNYHGNSDIKVPDTWDAIETLCSFFLDALWSKEMPVKKIGAEGSDMDLVELYNQDLKRKMSNMPNRRNFRDRNDEAIRNWLKFGFTAVKCPFEKSINGAGFIPLEPEEIYFNFYKKSTHLLDYICHKVKRSEASLFKNKASYNYGHNITKTKLKSAKKPEDTSGVYRHTLTNLKLSDQVPKSHMGYYDVYEHHILTDQGKGFKWHIATVVNGTVLIRFEEADYDFPPILICPLHTQKGLLVGMSIPRLVRGQQIERNDYRSQMMDAGQISLQQMYTVDKMADIDPYQLRNRPNGVVYSEIGGGVEPIRRDLGFLSVAQVMDGITAQAIQTLTGATPSLTDALQTSKTAFAERKNLANSTRRVLQLLRKYIDNVLFPWLELDFQYTSSDLVPYAEFVRVAGKDATAFGEERLKDFFDTKLDTIAEGFEDITDRVTKVQQELNNLNIAGGLPQFINVPRVAMDLYKAQGKKNVEDYVFGIPKPSMVSPEDENLLVSQGQEPDPPNPRDNHPYHLQKHNEAEIDSELKARIMDRHVELHKQAMAVMSGQQAPTPTQSMPQAGSVPQTAPSGVQESEMMAQAGRTQKSY